jgi:3-oxoacyl-[acyl-carrier-protein] synthase II
MTHPAYIRSASAISPQHSFYPGEMLQPLMHTGDGKLFVVDIDYRQYINPVAIRRMSRMLRITISAGMQCLKEAGIERPDAIITGTGRGSMNDTERFLNDMIAMQEQALNPTYFIQSTYNSPNGWLAMQTRCTGYNQTYVHRGSSFELALLDAQMLLQERAAEHVLVGCFDELTPDYFQVKHKIGYWKEELPDSLELLQHTGTKGTIAGEGSAFFTLSAQPQQALGVLRATAILNDPAPEEVLQQAEACLMQNGLSLADIDLFITGSNGASDQESVYQPIRSSLPDDTSVAGFKHLCGEYDTASGFGLWMAARLLCGEKFPAISFLKKGQRPVRTILLVNQYILRNTSVMLITKD